MRDTNPIRAVPTAAATPSLRWMMALPWLAALWLALLCGLSAAPARANEAAPAATDPVLEARMLDITAELRCLVCQNQTIADSHSDLASDLRQQVREMLQRGDSDKQIVQYMTERYGDFVLYRPPFKATTALLWLGPVLLLVGGLTVFVIVLRRRNRLSPDQFEPDEPGLNDEVSSQR